MEFKESIKRLLPDELEQLKIIIDELITELGLVSSTNKRYQLRNVSVKCPNCNGTSLHKNGTKNKTQRFKCCDCNKFFSITTNTFLSHSKLSFDQLVQFIECLANYNTIKITSKKVGISEREVYNLRIKLISMFSKFNNTILSEIVQADEKYVRISFKGTRKNKMPRKSHKNGKGIFDNIGSGISKKNHVCIVGAIDSRDNIILKVVGNGLATTDMISKGLKDKIKKGSTLVTDSKVGYIPFAKDNKLVLKQIPSGSCKIEEYHLGELNSLFSELEILMLNFRGLSTRHLQEYLDWFRCKKILKYTVEYLETTNEIFKFAIKEDSILTNKKVCKTPMPINVEEIFGKNID